MVVEKIVKMGADVNRWTKDSSPLITAVKRRNGHFAQVLVNAGADVNKTDVNLIPPLAIAARNKDFRSVNLLLEAGADVNKAFVKCALRNNVDMLKGMLCIGAQVNILNTYGQNTFSQYVRTCKVYNRTMVLFLLAAGEIVDHKSCERLRTFNSRFLKDPIWLPDFIQQSGGQNLDLRILCRMRIREHLLNLDPHHHLFHRVPRLGLPKYLSSFLLYNLSIDE